MIERDVADLRGRIARLEHTVAHLVKQLGIHVPAEAPPTGVSSRVLQLVREGNKMAAIMAHSQETGADVATAKRVIDSLG